MMLASAAIGVFSGVVGLYISFWNDIAAGGTIVLVATAVFGLVWLFAPQHGYVSTKLLRRRLATDLAETRVVFESPEIQRH